MKGIPIIFILLLLPLLASCGDPGPKAQPTATDINEPSITIHKFNGTVTVGRTLTNVGASKNVYLFSSEKFNGLYIMASPSQLSFNNVGEKKSFTITVQKDALGPPSKGSNALGEYTWTDGVHFVRTKVTVYFD